MYCPKCGNSVDGAKFCANCGTTLEAPLPQNTTVTPSKESIPLKRGGMFVVGDESIEYYATKGDVKNGNSRVFPLTDLSELRIHKRQDPGLIGITAILLFVGIAALVDGGGYGIVVMVLAICVLFIAFRLPRLSIIFQYASGEIRTFRSINARGRTLLNILKTREPTLVVRKD